MDLTLTNVYRAYPAPYKFEAESVLDAWVRLRSMMSGPNQTTFELHRLVKVSGPPVLTTPGHVYSSRSDHQVVDVWVCVAVGNTDFGLNGEIPGGVVVRVPPDSPDMRIQHEIGTAVATRTASTTARPSGAARRCMPLRTPFRGCAARTDRAKC